MKKKLHLMAFISLLAAATFSSCNNDDDDPTPPSGAIESNTVAAEVENFGNIALDSIVAVADEGRGVTVGSGAYSDGKLTVTLSAAVGSSALRKIFDEDMPSGVKVSNPNVKGIGEVGVYAYKSGSKAGEFSYGTAEWKSFLMYVDGDVSMTGSDKEGDTYSLTLKKGWNMVYEQTSGASRTITTAKPQDAKWSYQSEQYDTLKVVVYDRDSYKYIPVGSATFSNGELKLPTEAVGNAYLSEIFEGMPTGVTVSKPDVKVATGGSVHAYKAGAKVGELSLGTAEWRGSLWYVDSDVSVSGTGSFTEEEGESNTGTLSLTLKKGWNIVYEHEQYSEESRTFTITTTAPPGAKWDFIPDATPGLKAQKASAKRIFGL